MVSTAGEALGRFGILVNDAGFGGGIVPLNEQATENWGRSKRSI